MILLGLGLALVLAGGTLHGLIGRDAERRDRLIRRLVSTGSLIGAVPAIMVLVRDESLASGWLAARVGPFGLDHLSAWFVLVVLGVGGVIGAYGTAYLAPERGHRPVGLAHGLFAVLLISLVGVVTATTVVSFLASWEVMAVTAYLLVVFESRDPEARRAGFTYLILTHVATLALLAMFAAWATTPWAGFDALAEQARSGVVATGFVLGMALLAFGIKAGIVPVHFWLPGAHAAAPSHVSALLSGVMIKMGVYGLFRVTSLVSPPVWWGWALLGLGLVSAILGVLWALAQHDLKRLLAYHSVENVGIIAIGLGIGVLGTSHGRPVIAAVGYAGALLHTLNHALFKSLLFLGAGAVVRAAGTREIERLGAMARALPRTAALFLVGSLAIVGLPPFNGFVSEWLIYQGILEGALAAPGLRPMAFAAAGLALTGALALACFAKLYAVVFLGHPRAPRAAPLRPLALTLETAQIPLAAACLLLGLVPALGVVPAARVGELALGAASPPADLTRSARLLGAISIAIVGVVTIVVALNRRRAARRPVATAPTWSCAYPGATPRMQYTASSFASPLLRSFGPLAGVSEERSAGGFRVHAVDPVSDRLGRPLWDWIAAASRRLRFLQAGRMRSYLTYLVLTLMALLFYLAAGRAP